LETSALPTAVQARLKNLGYLTVEQVASARKMLGSRLDSYAGVELQPFLSKTPEATRPAQLAFAVTTADYYLGARLKKPMAAVTPKRNLRAAATIPKNRIAPAAAPPPFGGTPDVNLISEMPPIRNQQNRGTCVAFASVACLEHCLLAQHPALDLSEQFLYWASKQHDGDSNVVGTYVSVAIPLLAADGCCEEIVWPYNGNQVPGNESQGPPPANAQQAAGKYKAPRYNELTATDIAAIKQELALNRCVAVNVAYFAESWESTDTRSTGNITLPVPGGQTDDGHAVCLVGYEDLPGNPELGGGRFILRNSWNGIWGVNCSYGTGYGTIPYAYLVTYGAEAYSIG
jgi:hypothetical protein